MDDDEAPMALPLSVEELPQQWELERPDNRNIPVTLVTGFLGSGKTSLIRHVLTGDHGLRIAVIMNEFGESVEESYFHTPEGSQANLGEWIGLANGCLCCQVKSEFVQAIETLMSQETKTFDYILIETTGPVAASLWTDNQLEAGCQLDAIITVVDCLNIDRQLREHRSEGAVNEAQVQIAYADLILLNKMDLGMEEAVERSEADIRAINSGVTIMRTTKKFFNTEPLDVIAEDEEETPTPSTTTPTPAHPAAAGTTTSSHDVPVSPPQRGRGDKGNMSGNGTHPEGLESGRDSVQVHEETHPASGGRRMVPSKSRSRSVSRSGRRRSLSIDGESHTKHDADICSIALHTDKALDLEK
eukprot:gene24667-10294_t